LKSGLWRAQIIPASDCFKRVTKPFTTTNINNIFSVSDVSRLKVGDVSETISVPMNRVMVGAEMVPETSPIFNLLPPLMDKEDFINLKYITY
jgi:hypothetical protein